MQIEDDEEAQVRREERRQGCAYDEPQVGPKIRRETRDALRDRRWAAGR